MKEGSAGSDAERQVASSSRVAARVAWVLLALWIVVRPCLWGAQPLEQLWFLVCAAALILPAGWCIARALRDAAPDAIDDRWMVLGMCWALGLAALALVYEGLALLHIERAIVAWPIVSGLAVAFLAWRDRARTRPLERVPASTSGLAPWAQVLLALVLACTVSRSQLLATTQWWHSFDTDVLFHVGNATALHAGLPLGDPRVAGWPFHYHHYAYSLMNSVRELGGITLAEQMQRLGTSLAPLLVVLQTFNAARVLARSPAAGIVAAALVALHIDPGTHAWHVLGNKAYVMSFGSVFQCGLYYSPSEVLLLAYFATFFLVLARWLDGGRRSALALLALLACASAGTKAAGMPVVVGALAAIAGFGFLRRRAWAKRVAVAAIVATLGALPATLALAFAEPSFANAMLRWAPWQMLRTSGSFVPLARALGHTRGNAPLGVACLWAPVWMLGYFGLAAVAALTWIWVRRRALQALELFLVVMALGGAFLGFGYAAPGFSQLFSLYPGQVGLAVLAGAGLVSASYPRWWKVLGVLVLGGVQVANNAFELWTITRADLTAKGDEPWLYLRYRAGLDWLRDHTPRDAVVIERTPAMIASVHAERCSFFETSAYTAESYAAGWIEQAGWRTWHPPDEEPFAERAALVQRFFAGPERETVHALRAAAGPDRPLYAILDRLRVANSPELGSHYVLEPLGALALDGHDVALTPVFENEALRIYSVAER